MQTDNEKLLSDLPFTEKEAIPEQVWRKLEVSWACKNREIEDLVSEIHKTKVNADQLKFDFEKELVTLRSLLEQEGKEKAAADHNNEQNHKKLEDLEKELNQANERINDLLTQFEMCRTEQENANEDSSSIPSATLETKDRLIKELKQQISNVEKQLETAQNEKYKALIQTEEAHTMKVQFQYKERRLEQEKTLLSRQLELVMKQLEERANEALQLRGQMSTKRLSLQADLAKAIEEVRILKEEKEAVDKIVTEKTVTIDNLIKSLNEARMTENKLDSTFRHELAAQEKLANIYKENCEDQQKKCEEMESEMMELRQLVKSVTDQYNVLEKEKQSITEEYQVEIEKQKNIIEDLQNSMKSEPTSISTAGAAAAELHQKGIGLSQLYTDYMETKDKLLESEEENKKLNRYVDQILNEIERKAPLLCKQKEDYIRSLQTIESLRHEIDQSILRMELQQQQSETARRKYSIVTRENESLQKQVQDMSKQVTVLLTEVEASRLGEDALHPPEEELSANATGDDVITKKLVTFKSVSELQKQNIKLLASIRELSDQIEKGDTNSETLKEVQEEVKKYKKELDDLKENERHLKNLLESVSKQRDLYKTLSHEQNANNEPSEPPIPKRVVELTEKLEKCQKELAKVKNDYDEYRQEISKNDKIDADLTDKYRKELETVRSDHIRLQSKLEYKEEQLKTLTMNNESFQRQIKGLEKNTHTMQGIIGKHEGTIETLRSQTMKLSKDLSKAEVLAFNMKEERAMLKESEERLQAEIESLHKSKVSQDLILSNLEMIKNNLDRSEVESRMILENQVKKLNQECANLRLKIESNMELKELQAKLKTTQEIVETKSLEIDSLKKLLETTQKDLKESQDKLIEAENARPIESGDDVSERIGSLETKLKSEQSKIKELEGSLANSQSQCDKLKALNTEQEKQITLSAQASKIAENTLSRLRKDKTELEKQTTTLTAELSKLQQTISKDVSIDQLSELSKNLEEKENLLANMSKELNNLKQSEKEAIENLKKQEHLASLAQKKYEQEVMFHGADLQTLSALKQQVARHDEGFDEIKIAREAAESAVKALEMRCASKDDEIERTKEMLNCRITELEQQNHSLLEQFTQLSEKTAALQTKFASGGDVNVSITEDDARTTEQLSEVIKYLRKEKELSLHKVEVSRAESQRLEAQKKSLESQISLLNSQLAEEKQKNSSSLENLGRYGELMRKVHTLDALADSNHLLREEKENLLSQMAEAKARALTLETQLTPLQGKLKDVTKQLDILKTEKDTLFNEKELYKKRTEELVEKLNRNNPEDFAKLQVQLTTIETQLKGKENELARTKNLNLHLQKAQQQLMTTKNQALSQLTSLREELKKSTEEAKRMALEKAKAQQQLFQTTEKVKSLTARTTSTANQQLAEIQKMQEQATESQKREELQRKESESLRKDMLVSEKKLKENADTIESLEKQVGQLRRIAKKYKDRAGGATIAGEDVDIGTSEKVKELEEKIESLEKQLEEKQSDQAQSTQDQASQSTSQTSLNAALKTEYETRILLLEQQNEELNKKLTQQKQTSLVSKAVSIPIGAEKLNDPPPTANIKPMPAPVPVAATRPAQTASQSVAGSSKSIPTASIRPMTPSTVVIVSPLETEGSVSSTAALPTVTPAAVAQSFQATLTATVSPTPVSTSVVDIAPGTSSATGDSPGTSSANDNTPGTSSSTDNQETSHAQNDQVNDAQPSGSRSRESDDDQPSGSRKRKHEPEDDEETKRSRLEQDDAQPSSSSTMTKELTMDGGESNPVPIEEDSSSQNLHFILDNIEEREAQTQPEQSNQRPSFSLFGAPSTSQEQPSSTRPSFQSFQSGFEAADDRMVPSTPTLILQRPFEGISSMQVPPDDIFNAGVSQSSQEAVPSQGGLSEEINSADIDATRMDLGQEVSSQRVLSSVGVEITQAGEPSSDDNITSSGGEGFKEYTQAGPSSSYADVSQESEADAAQPQDTAENESEESKQSGTEETSEVTERVEPSVQQDSPSAPSTPPRRITPITWEEGQEASRGRGRGTVGRFVGRGTTRGQKAKRSRPNIYRGR